MSKIQAITRAVELEGFPFLTWSEWYPGGRPDNQWTKLVQQTFPATRHWVHHSVTNENEPPASAANTINRIGIQRFGKMSYPFLIHRSGTIIQGCYPYIGAHTAGYNSTSLAGCNIGNFEVAKPTDRMVQANVVLIRALVATGHYSSRLVPILGHRESPDAQTACPGDYMMAQLPEIKQGVVLPAPSPITDTQEPEMYFAQERGKPEVFFFEVGRYTHVKNGDDLKELAKAAGVSTDIAQLSSGTMTALTKGRTLYT